MSKSTATQPAHLQKNFWIKTGTIWSLCQTPQLTKIQIQRQRWWHKCINTNRDHLKSIRNPSITRGIRIPRIAVRSMMRASLVKAISQPRSSSQPCVNQVVLLVATQTPCWSLHLQSISDLSKPGHKSITRRPTLRIGIFRPGLLKMSNLVRLKFPKASKTQSLSTSFSKRRLLWRRTSSRES